jgi:hypothetical protein
MMAAIWGSVKNPERADDLFYLTLRIIFSDFVNAPTPLSAGYSVGALCPEWTYNFGIFLDLNLIAFSVYQTLMTSILYRSVWYPIQHLVGIVSPDVVPVDDEQAKLLC